MTARILHGDCIAIMAAMPDESVDAIVTDPPYGLGFMGKAWDALPPGKEWAEECLRVLKPGGHLLAFGGTRTWHRLAVAVEDAGFEIRDSIAWLYGSGFPKSLDVSKAIDKAAGAEREVIGTRARPDGTTRDPSRGGRGGGTALLGSVDGSLNVNGAMADITAPATPEAVQWQGWGTALKPAFEPVVLARKPLVGTVAANVQEHGTGALNIDGCRIGTDENLGRPTVGGSFRLHGFSTLDELRAAADVGGKCPDGRDARSTLARTLAYMDTPEGRTGQTNPAGRWPANVILDESQAAALDKQSGGASRFFYVAKAPKKERPVVDGVAHPTVKPLALMRWLVRLITPPGGTVLEPFAGSGTTVEAALLEGFDVVGIEREADYLPLIQARIDRITALEKELEADA